MSRAGVAQACGCSSERNEAVRRAVERIDRAGFDVVHPAVQSQMSLFEREPHGGMRLDVRELGDHVFADHRVDPVAFALVLTRLVDDLRGIRVVQPVRARPACGPCTCRWRSPSSRRNRSGRRSRLPELEVY